MKQKQKTLKKEVSFKGIGVHSGQPATVVLRPRTYDQGIFIINSAIPDEVLQVGTIVPEVAMHATVLKHPRWMISTVEHLMAAVSVMGIDNIEVWVEGPEIPIFDGSALPFVQGIIEMGLQEQEAPKRWITPVDVLTLKDQHGRWIEITPTESSPMPLTFDYVGEFKHPLIGKESLQGAVTIDYFVQELAPARTFGFIDQLPYLRGHGLAQGTSLGNTVVLGQEELLNEMRVADECIKHKVLDLIGDLALLGKPLAGHVRAYKTGHSFNRLVIEHYLQNPLMWRVLEFSDNHENHQ